MLVPYLINAVTSFVLSSYTPTHNSTAGEDVFVGTETTHLTSKPYPEPTHQTVSRTPIQCPDYGMNQDRKRSLYSPYSIHDRPCHALRSRTCTRCRRLKALVEELRSQVSFLVAEVRVLNDLPALCQTPVAKPERENLDTEEEDMVLWAPRRKTARNTSLSVSSSSSSSASSSSMKLPHRRPVSPIFWQETTEIRSRRRPVHERELTPYSPPSSPSPYVPAALLIHEMPHDFLIGLDRFERIVDAR